MSRFSSETEHRIGLLSPNRRRKRRGGRKRKVRINVSLLNTSFLQALSPAIVKILAA
jgi:hypothetical protein